MISAQAFAFTGRIMVIERNAQMGGNRRATGG